ncbi:hypothetical protein [Yersinia proxima]|nr:hypothetical protein [Yersinia proxima]
MNSFNDDNLAKLEQFFYLGYEWAFNKIESSRHYIVLREAAEIFWAK